MKYILFIVLSILIGLLIILILCPFIYFFYKIIMLFIDKLDDWFGGWFE